MKKTVLIAVALLASAGAFVYADESQDKNVKDAPRQGRFLQDARTEDGKIDLAKALASDKTPEPLKEALKKADKDGDGFLAPDELRTMRQERAGQKRERGKRNERGPKGGPQFGQHGPHGGPQFGQHGPQGGSQFGQHGSHGGPQFGQQGPQGGPQFGQSPFPFANVFKDGKLELAKLPEQAPQQFKDAMKGADKDGDGFLAKEELDAMPKPEFPKWDKGGMPKFEAPKFDFINEDGAIDVAKITEKVTEAIKKADKNGDGIIDKEEQDVVKKFVFEKAKRFFMQRAMKNKAPGFGPHGQPFGMPGFGPNGQPFGKPGFSPQGQPSGMPGFAPQGQPFGKPGFGSQGQPFGMPGFAPQCPGCDNPECKDCKDKEQSKSEEPKAEEKTNESAE